MTSPELPDTATLESHVRDLDLEGDEGSLQLEQRERLISGTCPKEIVSCRLLDGRQLRLFCKYGAGRNRHTCLGHRGGIAREIAVYQEALEPLGIPSPQRFRSRHGALHERTWLVLEHLEGSQKVSRVPGGVACEEAARAAGRIHAIPADSLPPNLHGALPTHGSDYYRGGPVVQSVLPSSDPPAAGPRD